MENTHNIGTLSISERLNNVGNALITRKAENEVSIRRAIELYDSINLANIKHENAATIMEEYTKSISVLQQISDERSEASKAKIESIVNNSLASVFADDPYTIKIDDYTRGRHLYSRILCIDAFGNERTLKNTTGQGVKEVISFLTNIVIIALTKASRFIMMDEILSSISTHNSKIMGEVLSDLTDSGFQFLAIEHKDTLFEIDNMYTFQLNKTEDGRAEVTTIKNNFNQEQSEETNRTNIIGEGAL